MPASPSPADFDVSIHAPLTGGDGVRRGWYGRCWCFNPRPPHGRRRCAERMVRQMLVFQSTPPSREATCLLVHHLPISMFQSTPPSREATGSLDMGVGRYRRFNPRPPHGRRPPARTARCLINEFQSTPPSREATRLFHTGAGTEEGFNPRPPHGRRRDAARHQR